MTKPTEWCSPIVVTRKKDSDKVRLYVNLSWLNRYVKLERYQFATPAQAVADIAAQKGYHQCPLVPVWKVQIYPCSLWDIPLTMQQQILQELHSAHQGTVRTKLRAQPIAYWPGINNDINNTIPSCKQCQDHLPSNPKEPLTPKPKPCRPFQEIAADFCHHAGHDFFIVVDCYSGFITTCMRRA